MSVELFRLLLNTNCLLLSSNIESNINACLSWYSKLHYIGFKHS